jgi:hypothetical protein
MSTRAAPHSGELRDAGIEMPTSRLDPPGDSRLSACLVTPCALRYDQRRSTEGM